jgi:hypothetical protein
MSIGEMVGDVAGLFGAEESGAYKSVGGAIGGLAANYMGPLGLAGMAAVGEVYNLGKTAKLLYDGNTEAALDRNLGSRGLATGLSHVFGLTDEKAKDVVEGFNATKIAVNEFATGIYTLQLQTINGTQQFKVIVE